MTPGADSITTYVACVFGPSDWVEVRRLPSRNSSWHRADSLADCAGALARDNQAGENVYVGANPRKGVDQRGDDGVELARCLFADFDKTTVDDALRRVQAAGLASPTLTIASGHGAHVYWRFDEPFTDLAEWRRIQKNLIALLDSDKSIHNPERIMRLPGFVNQKPPVADCIIIEADPSRVYSWADVLPLIPKRTSAAGNGHHPAKPTGNSIAEGNRNGMLASLAGTMRRRGMNADAIGAALLAENRAKCCPPLEDDEVRRIAQSVAKYPPRERRDDSATEQGADELRATELRNAELVAEQYWDAIRFNVDRGEWMVWTGSHWKRDDVGYVVNCVKAEARRTRHRLIQAGAVRKDAERTATRMESAAGVAGVEKLLRSEPSLTVRADALDRDDFALNVLNGTVDLRTDELRPHNRDELITRVLPFEFDPYAAAPRWQQFIREITDGDEELAGYLQRLAGLYASGDTSVEEFYVFHGTGSNGKSKFIDTILHVLGDYAGLAPDSLLMLRRNQEHPTELASLLGKRLVVASETEEGGTLRLQLVKRLTGDEQITARFMRQDFFTFRRTHKLLTVTNNKPRVPESTEAAWRRIRLVPFDVTIPLERRDGQLLEKLKAEAQGILAWLVRGSVERIAKGMQTPQRVVAATSAYRDESDPLADYAADRLVLGERLRVVRGEIWTDYESWAVQAGEKGSLTRDKFYGRVRLLPGVRDDEWKLAGQKVRGFLGVGLKATNQS